MGVSSLNKSINFFKSLFNPNTVTTKAIEFKEFKPEYLRNNDKSDFETVTPESQGVDSAYIQNFLTEIKNDTTLNMQNIIILKNGKIISKTEFGNSDLGVWKMTFSACKSIVSLAVGMLVDDKKLDINTPIVEFFPEYTNALSKIRMREITVKTLLTMSTGSTFNEFLCMTSNNWEQSFFKGAFSIKPGSDFNYNSLNTYMLGVIVAKVSGQSLLDFLRVRLFEPLKIETYYFEKSPTRFERGGWGLYMLPEDLAKIGQLVLNNGIWENNRLISEEWLNAATSKQISTPKTCGDFDYGYQIWVGRDTNTFLFNGMFGQNVLGFKSSGILIVSNAGNNELFQQSNYFKLVLKYFSKDFPNALIGNKKSYVQLRKFNDSLSFNTNGLFERFRLNSKRKLFIKKCGIIGQEFIGISPNVSSLGLFPQILQITQNNYSTGFKSIKFIVKGSKIYLLYYENNAEFNIPLGVEEYITSQVDFYGEKHIISSAVFLNRDENNQTAITVKIDFLETCSSRILKFYSKNGKRYLKQSEKPGKELIFQSLETFKNSASKNKAFGLVLGKLDSDYLLYKTQRIFEPVIELVIKQ